MGAGAGWQRLCQVRALGLVFRSEQACREMTLGEVYERWPSFDADLLSQRTAGREWTCGRRLGQTRHRAAEGPGCLAGDIWGSLEKCGCVRMRRRVDHRLGGADLGQA